MKAVTEQAGKRYSNREGEYRRYGKKKTETPGKANEEG